MSYKDYKSFAIWNKDKVEMSLKPNLKSNKRNRDHRKIRVSRVKLSFQNPLLPQV